MATKNNRGKYDCYENAEYDEPMFTVLARDKDGSKTVAGWAMRRLRRFVDEAKEQGKDSIAVAEIEQILEALDCAEAMHKWREEHRK